MPTTPSRISFRHQVTVAECVDSYEAKSWDFPICAFVAGMTNNRPSRRGQQTVK